LLFGLQLKRLPRRLFGDHLELWTIMLCAGLFLAFIGAFETLDDGIARRFGYWLSLMFAGGMLAVAVTEILDRAAPLSEQRVAKFLAAILMLSLPQTLVVFVASVTVLGRDWGVSALIELFPGVLVVSSAILSIDYIATKKVQPTPAVAPSRPAARLSGRLPMRLRSCQLYAIEAQDHYLRVHTEGGAELILMRFSDALEDVQGLDGVQSHRSWWVARSAIAGGRSSGRRGTLLLKNGLEIPVSRSNLSKLRRDSWW